MVCRRAIRLGLRLLADVSIRNSSESNSVVLEERKRRGNYVSRRTDIRNRANERGAII